MESIERQILTLEDRKKLTLTQVSSVDDFSEERINLTINNIKVKVCGEKLKIVNFNKSSGNFCIEGVVDEIKFGSKKTSIIKKIFK